MSEAHHHDHDHDHEHHHEHAPAQKEEFAIEGAQMLLEAHTHEQAATVSLDVKPAEGAPLAFKRLIDLMVSIAGEAEAHGGIVGHIKAFAREGDTFAHASVTASDLPVESEGAVEAVFGHDATIQLVAIVLLIDKQALVDICKAAW